MNKREQAHQLRSNELLLTAFREYEQDLLSRLDCATSPAQREEIWQQRKGFLIFKSELNHKLAGELSDEHTSKPSATI